MSDHQQKENRMPKNLPSVETVNKCLRTLYENPTRVSITVFETKKLRVRATRKVRRQQKSLKWDGEIILSLGRPNFREASYIKKNPSATTFAPNNRLPVKA